MKNSFDLCEKTHNINVSRNNLTLNNSDKKDAIVKKPLKKKYTSKEIVQIIKSIKDPIKRYIILHKIYQNLSVKEKNSIDKKGRKSSSTNI